MLVWLDSFDMYVPEAIDTARVTPTPTVAPAVPPGPTGTRPRKKAAAPRAPRTAKAAAPHGPTAPPRAAAARPRTRRTPA